MSWIAVKNPPQHNCELIGSIGSEVPPQTELYFLCDTCGSEWMGIVRYAAARNKDNIIDWQFLSTDPSIHNKWAEKETHKIQKSVDEYMEN